LGQTYTSSSASYVNSPRENMVSEAFLPFD
jgi:hypothetical protein